MQRFYRALAFGAGHTWDRVVELELVGRFTVALQGFSEASDRVARRLLVATWVLVALTVAILALTVALLVGGSDGGLARTVTVPAVTNSGSRHPARPRRCPDRCLSDRRTRAREPGSDPGLVEFSCPRAPGSM